VRRIAPFVLILFCLATASAKPKQDKVTKQFFGVWRLAAIEGQPPGRPDFYVQPTGIIFYDPSGWMSVQIANKSDRQPIASSLAGARSATLEAKAAAYDSYLAYYGKYEVDAKAQTITHHIEDYTFPGRRGTDNVRWFEFQGANRLALIPVEDGKGGVLNRKNATYKLIWERFQ
jgi:Lipocalin-like domain